MPEAVENLLQLYRTKLELLSDSHIKKIILYGSYARGDFQKDSDIDVMVLVDMKDFKDFEDKVFNLTYDFNLEHHTDIMPIVQNFEHFNYWKNAYMFYRNINREGISI